MQRAVNLECESTKLTDGGLLHDTPMTIRTRGLILRASSLCSLCDLPPQWGPVESESGLTSKLASSSFFTEQRSVAMMIGLNWTQRTVICWRWRTSGIWTNEICRVNINVCLCIILRSPWDNSVHPKYLSSDSAYVVSTDHETVVIVLYQISYLASFL